MSDRKEVEPHERQGREELGGIERGETITRIYYVRRKKSIFKKKGGDEERQLKKMRK